MISAKAALQLEQAQFTSGDIVQFRAVMDTIDRHIRETMTFMGPAALEIPYRDMSKETCKLMCHAMKYYKWNVNANLIASQPRFAGGQPEPHHWFLQFQPAPEVYDELDLVQEMTAADPLH